MHGTTTFAYFNHHESWAAWLICAITISLALRRRLARTSRGRSGCVTTSTTTTATIILVLASGELRTQKLKSHLVRTQTLNVLPFKPGVGQYIAIHATLTAREFFLISTLPVHSSAFFPKPLPIFSCVGLQNEIGHPAGCRFPC